MESLSLRGTTKWWLRCGHNPLVTTILNLVCVHYVVLCTVCVYMCTVVLPPGVNKTAINKYIDINNIRFLKGEFQPNYTFLKILVYNV